MWLNDLEELETELALHNAEEQEQIEKSMEIERKKNKKKQQKLIPDKKVEYVRKTESDGPIFASKVTKKKKKSTKKAAKKEAEVIVAKKQIEINPELKKLTSMFGSMNDSSDDESSF